MADNYVFKPNKGIFMRFPGLVLIAGFALACSSCATPEPEVVPLQPARNGGVYVAVPLDGFADGIHHWRNRYGDAYAKYDQSQIIEIAENVLRYQRNNGGWIENRDPMRILSEQEQIDLLKEKDNPTYSFDNRNIYSQIEYLSAVYSQTGDARYRDSALRGLVLTFGAQYRNCGGWPHTVPGTESYHPYITMADEVTSGVLRMMRKINAAETPFAWVDAGLRKRAGEALLRGDDCILRLQVRQADGRLAAWAGQYNPETLLPADGRTFELASVVSWESVEVVRYLMGIPHPTPEQVAAIQGAVDWFERSAITGWKIEQFPINPPIKYTYHTAKFDRRFVPDPNAPRTWARFYDLNDNSVVLANRDGKRVKEYSQIHQERRTGYAWYSTWPEEMLSRDYPAWKARMQAQGVKIGELQ